MANSVTHYKMEVEIDPAAWRLRVAADLTLGNTELLDLYLGPGAVIDELVEPEAAETTRVYDPDIPRVAPVSYMWKSP